MGQVIGGLIRNSMTHTSHFEFGQTLSCHDTKYSKSQYEPVERWDKNETKKLPSSHLTLTRLIGNASLDHRVNPQGNLSTCYTMESHLFALTSSLVQPNMSEQYARTLKSLGVSLLNRSVDFITCTKGDEGQRSWNRCGWLGGSDMPQPQPSQENCLWHAIFASQPYVSLKILSK